MPTLTIKAIGKHIVVKPQEKEGRTPGGIMLPDGAQKEQHFGTVIDAGVNVSVEVCILRGATVAYGKYSGQELTVGDTTYRVLHEDDILAVIE